MVQVTIYTIITIFISAFAYLFHPQSRELKGVDEINRNALGLAYTYKSRIFIILIISIILSLYSTYLAVSNLLVDATRYEWSFYNRYPFYYDSLESMLSANTEIGFLLLNKFVYIVSGDSDILFMITAFITNILILYVASKINKNFGVFVLLFMISQFYFFSTYALKQALAVGFSSLAILSYFKTKRINYFFYSIIAITFHTSAVVMLPLYFFFKTVRSIKSYLLITFLFIVGLISFDYIFYNVLPNIPLINTYLVENTSDFNVGDNNFLSTLKGVPIYILVVIALLKRNELKIKYPNVDIFILSALFFAISWLFSFNLYWLFRFSWYFGILTLSLIPLVTSIINNKHGKFLFVFSIIGPMLIITFRQIFLIIGT